MRKLPLLYNDYAIIEQTHSDTIEASYSNSGATYSRTTLFTYLLTYLLRHSSGMQNWKIRIIFLKCSTKMKLKCEIQLVIAKWIAQLQIRTLQTWLRDA